MYGEDLLVKTWGHLRDFKPYRGEWRSACPDCGGGDPSDRFIMKVPDAEMDIVRGWCRQCNVFIVAREDGHHSGNRLTSEEIAELRAASKAKKMAELEMAEQKLDYLRNHLDDYHDMTLDERGQWHKHGLNDWSIDRWRLGYVHERAFGKDDNDLWIKRDALVIPIWGMADPETSQWEVGNVQFRILNPPDGMGKYKQVKGVPVGLFHTVPESSLTGAVTVVEGAKKAMVLSERIARETGELQNIVAISSATPSKQVIEQFSQVEKMYLILDPDTRKRRVGNAAKNYPTLQAEVGAKIMQANPNIDLRYVQVPAKVDDFFTVYGEDLDTLRPFFENAIPARRSTGPRTTFAQLSGNTWR